MEKKLKQALDIHCNLVAEISPQIVLFLTEVANITSRAFVGGNKLLIAGNGGSAADAQHLAAEFVGRFSFNRPALPAIALTTDSSILTAVANDFSFNTVFSRQLEALGKSGDVLMVISTSGRSKNCIEAVQEAKRRQIHTIGLLGNDGGDLAEMVDSCFIVPSEDVARIQEVHLLVEHLLCAAVETLLFRPGS